MSGAVKPETSGRRTDENLWSGHRAPWKSKVSHFARSLANLRGKQAIYSAGNNARRAAGFGFAAAAHFNARSPSRAGFSAWLQQPWSLPGRTRSTY